MKTESKREKFLFWVIENSTKPWLWLPVLLVATTLINIPVAGLGGLGLLLWGAVTFFAGIDFTLETKLGTNYNIEDKEKKNDTTH